MVDRMVRDPFADEEVPDLQELLGALEDPDCRTIVRRLDEPMTASELSDECDIPLSTIYRKLDTMSDATLLDELTEVRSDGHHTTRYDVAFDEIRILLEEDRSLDVELSRPAQTADERLADMWSEVSKEL
jgi:DNA-binding IclR family transcriptional regulator